jgi:D-tyrosyl-tRNA(Tyr) deacylase
LTQTPELNADWLARLQALGAGELPSGGGSGAMKGATPQMIDVEKNKKRDKENKAKQAAEAKERTLSPAEMTIAARLQAMQNAGQPQFSSLHVPGNYGENMYGGSAPMMMPRNTAVNTDALYDVYQQYLGSRGQ